MILNEIIFYKTKGGWRWRLKSRHNGKIVGASSEAYKNGKMCVANFSFLTGYKFPELFKVRDKVSLVINLDRV